MTTASTYLFRKLILTSALLIPLVNSAQQKATKEPDQVAALMADTKIYFRENKGQLKDVNNASLSDVLFTTKLHGQQLYFRPTGISYVFTKWEKVKRSDERGARLVPEQPTEKITGAYRMDMELLDANPNPRIRGESETGYTENYYLSDSSILDVKSFERIVYKDIYPQIDLVYYSNGKDLEYDFVVHPGGNPADIRMKFIGANNLSLSKDGKLKLKTPLGKVEEQTPYTYTKENSQPINSSFKLEENELTFALSSYDHTKTLVIDPITRVWGTYYGGTESDVGRGVAIDVSGNIFMTGETASTSGIATIGSFVPNPASSRTSFLVKFNSNGVRQWGIYYGGNYIEPVPHVEDLAVDNCGNVVVTGATNNNSGIATAGAFQPNLGGGSNDGFIMKFNSSGSRVWGTYFGGSSGDYISAVDIDFLGNILVTGRTSSATNIATPSSHQPVYGGDKDAFIAKFSKSGERLWSTYYGGAQTDDGEDVAADHLGNVLVTGSTYSPTGIATAGAHKTSLGDFGDTFVVKFNSGGTRSWGTYFGGSFEEINSEIATGPSGSFVITGETRSTDGIATPGAYDDFFLDFGDDARDTYISKFNASGVQQWGTYFGMFNWEDDPSVVVDDNGNIFVCGATYSDNEIHPPGLGLSTPDGHKVIFGGDWVYPDVYIAKFSTNGSRLWGSYYGADNQSDFAYGLDIFNNTIVVAGVTLSENDIATPGSHQPNLNANSVDAFLVKFSDTNLTESKYQLINALVGSHFCTGNIAIPYFATGTYDAANNFIALLSDVDGNFGNPLIIGTKNSTVSGTINAFIPVNIPFSNTYKIRIISSNPTVLACNDTGYLVIGLGPNTITGGEGAFCNSAPAVNIIGTTPIYGGNGIYGFQWQYSTNNVIWNPLFGANNKDYAAPAINATRYYRRTVFSDGCSYVSNTISRIVTPNISGNTIGPDQSYCAPTNPGWITGPVPGGGDGTLTYQWQQSADQINWTNIGFGGSSKDFDPPFIINVTLYYRRKVISGSCENISNIVTVTIGQPISNNSISGGTSFCGSIDPSAITNTTPLGGNGIFSYQWEISSNGILWSPIGGATGKDYNPPLTSVTFYLRRKVFSSNCALSFSNVIGFIKSGNLPAPQTITASGPLELCSNGSVKLSVNEEAGATYQWKKNGTAIPAATDNEYLVVGEFGSFTVDITTCTTISSNSVQVIPLDCFNEATARQSKVDGETFSEETTAYPHPNPVKNGVLHLDGFVKSGFEKYEITTMDGIIVSTDKILNEINVSGISKRAYIITLFKSNGERRSFRFVKE